MTFRCAGRLPPIVLATAPAEITTPLALGSALLPVTVRPIGFPCNTLAVAPAPVIETPAALLPAIRLRWVVTAPPTVLLGAPLMRMPTALGWADVPSGLVPRKFVWIVLPPAPLI